MVDELSQMKEDRIMMMKTGTAEIVVTNTEIQRGSLLKAEKVQEKEAMGNPSGECTCRKEEKVEVKTGETGTAQRQVREVYQHVIVEKGTALHLDQRTRRPTEEAKELPTSPQTPV